jgi:hypothetical protein
MKQYETCTSLIFIVLLSSYSLTSCYYILLCIYIIIYIYLIYYYFILYYLIIISVRFKLYQINSFYQGTC